MSGTGAELERLWDPDKAQVWRMLLTGAHPALRKGRAWRRRIPARYRCKNCLAPFDGPGARLMRLLGRGRYDRNPQFCRF